jgi:hypothetical protein
MWQFMRQPTAGKKKKKMFSGKIYAAGFVALALLSLLVAGCNGVLYEKQKENGGVSRLCINQDDGWDSLNIIPRYWSQNPKDQSSYSIMLKNEQTF